MTKRSTPAQTLIQPPAKTPALPLGLLLCLPLALTALPGCNGCNEPKPEPPPAEAAAKVEAAPAPEAKPEAKPAPKAAPEPAAEPKAPYRGPTSKNPGGYTITTGFSGEDDKPVQQPEALAKTTVYVTVLEPGDAPIGTFDTFEKAELHGFLVARDLRHAIYDKSSGAVAVGADARKVAFTPREGGDHALVTVFKPVGKPAQAVSAPVVFKGALPKIAGRGVAGLSARSRVKGGDIALGTAPEPPEVGKPLTLTAKQLDNTGTVKATVRPAFAVVLNDALGGGEVVTFSQAGTATWTPQEPGTYLLMTPPVDPKSTTPLTFKIEVPDPKAAKPDAPAAAAKPSTAK